VNRRKRIDAIVQRYLAGRKKPSDEALTTSPSAQQLETLVGNYRDPKTGEVWRLTMADSKLWADFEGFPLELRALSSMEFEPVNYVFETRLKFDQIVEKSSVRRRLTVKREMELPTTFDAIEEARPSVEELGAYTGDYWSDELRAT
jgi:hypothetical protein